MVKALAFTASLRINIPTALRPNEQRALFRYERQDRFSYVTIGGDAVGAAARDRRASETA